jgi:hypothetical protein
VILRGIFSVSKLNGLVRAGDSQRFDVDLKKSGPTIILKIAADAISGTVDLAVYFKAKVKKKTCISYRDYAANIVLRAIARYITRRFRVAAPNRDRIVKGVIETMMDQTPFYVIRRDITSFYETIPTEAIRDRLVFDTAVPRSIRHYLKQFFSQHCSTGTAGFPRGVSLTAVLVELVMEKFDRAVSAIPGVYRYFRYSDDMLVFCYENPNAVEVELGNLLMPGMAYNTSKSSVTAFAQKPATGNAFFEFLGYRFTASNGIGNKKPRKVEVTISERKLKLLKSRVFLSLKSHKTIPDPALLLDRVRLITSNHEVHRRGISAVGSSRYVRAGIYYNYQRCGTYEGGAFIQVIPTQLDELDNFLFGLMKGSKSPFKALLSATMTKAQRDALFKMSFRMGFQHRILVSFPYPRMAQMKKAWRNA